MEITVKNQNIKINYIDNLSNKTLLCVHGFNSNKDFIKNLGQKNSNFNIVSFTIPEIEKMSVEYMTLITEQVIKKVKHSKIYVLGHSLGGAVVSRLRSKKIKGIVYVSSIHPYLVKTKQYQLLNTTVKPKNKIQSVIGKIAIQAAKATNKGAIFVDETLPWFAIVKNQILNSEFMEKLDIDMKKSNNKIFIVGDKDPIISTNDFVNYVNKELNQKVFVIEGKHNPFGNNEIQNIINKEIEFKKRWAPKFRKIIKINS